MGRRKDTDQLTVHAEEICRLYRTGETIKGLRARYSSTDRSIRKLLTDNGVTIRPQGHAGRWQREIDQGLTPTPPKRTECKNTLPPEEVDRLRREIGYDPAWAWQ